MKGVTRCRTPNLEIDRIGHNWCSEFKQWYFKTKYVNLIHRYIPSFQLWSQSRAVIPPNLLPLPKDQNLPTKLGTISVTSSKVLKIWNNLAPIPKNFKNNQGFTPFLGLCLSVVDLLYVSPKIKSSPNPFSKPLSLS